MKQTAGVVEQPTAGIAGQSTTPQQRPPFWPNGWWKIVDYRIGIMPLPVFVALAVIMAVFIKTGKIPVEINVILAILVLFGFSCAEIGKRLPYLGKIGAPAIFATFLPSYLAFHHVVPADLVRVVSDFTTNLHFIYLFIAVIIVGSIFSMDRQVLIAGFVRIFVPLAVGSIAAMIVGTAVGAALGLGVFHTFFFIVVPIMAGGVGEGAIPLSLGYSEILKGTTQGDIFAQVLPPIMVGNLCAILLSGTLNYAGTKFPHLTGNGYLTPSRDNLQEPADAAGTPGPEPGTIGAAAITAITLYLIGLLCHRLFGLPAPVAMLFVAMAVKLAKAVSPQLMSGSRAVYRFFSTSVTYPQLFAIGVSMTPWDKLCSAFTLCNLITIMATVCTLMTTGFFVGMSMKLYPIDTAIVTACHSGQGGTGDVAILTAANRMSLMPFAQIATRIGGAITVTLVLIVLARMMR